MTASVTLIPMVITFRTDDEVDRALAELAGDQERSQVIRAAILTVWRLQRREALRAQARTVADDPADRAEARAVLADMERFRAR